MSSDAHNVSTSQGGIKRVQKSIDVARSRGILMREILQYDHVAASPLFYDDMTAKPQKHTIITELENHLANQDFSF